MTTAVGERKRKQTTRSKPKPPADPPIDDQDHGDDGGDGGDDDDGLDRSWPDLSKLRQLDRIALRPGAELPFRQLRLKVATPDKFKQPAADFNGDVDALQARYTSGDPTINYRETSIDDLEVLGRARRAELLETLQDAYDLASRGVKLAAQLEKSWAAEIGAILDRESAVMESTAEALDAVYPDEHPAVRRGRLNTSPAMVNFRAELSTARNHQGAASQEVNRLTDVRAGIALELETFCRSLI